MNDSLREENGKDYYASDDIEASLTNLFESRCSVNPLWEIEEQDYCYPTIEFEIEECSEAILEIADCIYEIETMKYVTDEDQVRLQIYRQEMDFYRSKRNALMELLD